MDWGLGNPNKTAVLIACLMVISWAMAARRFRPWGFWVALVLNAALGVCLIHTYSRGGLVAMLVSQIAWWLLQGGCPRREKLSAVAVAIFLAIYANLGFVDAGSRYAQGARLNSDRSISNRLVMWRKAPRMMIDAPGGWGLGNSGEAYTQWYQPSSSRYTYRTLVNSHLTRLVELGWIGRFLYLMGWTAVLLFCWPSPRSSATAAPFACWVAFGVGGVFSTVDEAWHLWVVPVLCLVTLVGQRAKSGALKRTPWRQQLLVASGASVTILLAFAIAGELTPAEVRIRGGSKVIVVGCGRDLPPITLLAPHKRVVGTHYGINARESLLNEAKGPPIAVVRAVADVPQNASRVVVSGEIPLFDSLGLPWTALNPMSEADITILHTVGESTPGVIILGAFRSDPAARFVRQNPSPNWEVREVQGKQIFLSNWAQVVYPPSNPIHPDK